MNDGSNAKKNFPRCGSNNHKLAGCIAKTYYDGTVLHIMGDVEEIDEEVSSKISAILNICCDSKLEELMFIQPHVHSPEEKQSACSKNLILKTWILLDSQSTVDVISNGDLLTKINQVKLHPELDVMQG